MASCSEVKKKLVLLISSDNELFEVPEAAVLISGTIDREILKYRVSGKGIRLRKVNSKTLRKVLEFCSRYVNAKDTLYINETLEQFETNFFQSLKTNDLKNLILAADYLDIQYMLAQAIDFVPRAMIGKTREEQDEFYKQRYQDKEPLDECINRFLSRCESSGRRLTTPEENKRARSSLVRRRRRRRRMNGMGFNYQQLDRAGF